MKHLIKEARRMQQLAGIIKESTEVDSIVAKHEPALLAALEARQANPEDEEAYYDVQDHLKAIASELGLDTTIPFMEDEMYSGNVSAEEAMQYIKEMFSDWVQDTM
tara:strand:+ start:99 stop:416 length:318 start_codon:yes stop_codon:yes gene_type:complete